jgi:hypothetical protein
VKGRPLLAGAVLGLVYLLATWPGRDVYPRVWVDEGWIAEAAWTAAAGEPLGNPAHGSLHRYADRVYWMPPLYFLTLSGVYRLGAPPLEGGRVLSLILGAVTLVILFAWGKRVLRESGGASSQILGIGFWSFWIGLAFSLDPMLWKVHRTIRFESMTTLWLVAAVATAWSPRLRLRGVASGLAAGAALLTHPTGGLALPAVVAVLWLRPGGDARRAAGEAAAAVGAALLVVLPFAAYLLGDRSAGFANVLGQNAPHLTGRDHPLIVQWLEEWRRWRRYFAWPALSLPLALWIVTVVVGVRLRAPRALVAVLGILVLGTASFPNKSEVYLTAAAPFLYLLAAWDGARLDGRPARGLAILWLAFLAAADVGLLVRDRACGYDRFRAELAAAAPPGSRVAGSFVTWFAFPGHAYMEFHRRRAGDLAEAQPDLVVWGDSHLMEPIFDRLRSELTPWLSQHADTVAVAVSPCYGTAAVLRPRWNELDPDAARRWERFGEAPR